VSAGLTEFDGCCDDHSSGHRDLNITLTVPSGTKTGNAFIQWDPGDFRI
jgi:hypothetical protein